jgi:hypothetical protein
MMFEPSRSRRCAKCGARHGAALKSCMKCGAPVDEKLGWNSHTAVIDDASEGESDSPDAARTSIDTGNIDTVTTAGWWLLLMPFLLAGVSLEVVGILLAVRNAEYFASAFVICFGSIILWMVIRSIRHAIDESRSSAAEAFEEELIDEGDDDESWRIPGYGSDAEERSH